MYVNIPLVPFSSIWTFMLQCDASDITNCLLKAPNINSAIKNFLKREVKKGDPAERFAKTLKDVLASQNEVRSQQFVAEAMPKFVNHLHSVACYAYFEVVGKLAAAVVDKYADDFNATFEIADGVLSYKDETRFKKISDEALAILRNGLKEQGFGDSAFMKNITMLSIFERPVIEVLAPKF